MKADDDGADEVASSGLVALVEEGEIFHVLRWPSIVTTAGRHMVATTPRTMSVLARTNKRVLVGEHSQ